jgi:hypothetical protein
MRRWKEVGEREGGCESVGEQEEEREKKDN